MCLVSLLLAFAVSPTANGQSSNDPAPASADSQADSQDGSDKNPTYGTVWIKGRTSVDKTSRVVTIDEFTITKTKFPTTTATSFAARYF
jgi:hypothetical protein